MNILVTGAGGYIGSHMVLKLIDEGESVWALDSFTTGFPWAIHHKAQTVEGDIGDVDLVTQLLRDNDIKSVFHFAGSVVVPESVADPLKYYHNNTLNTARLLEACLVSGVEDFVFSSTAAVYGNVSGDPVREDQRLSPQSPYGRSKLMSEMMLQDVGAAHGLRHAILRYFNVAGADPGGRSGQSTKGATHLIKVAVEAALGKRNRIEIYGTDYQTPDGTCQRDYIHVSDLIDAHYLALRHLHTKGESVTLNIGYGSGYSVRDVLETVQRRSGNPLDIVESPRRAGDVAQIVADPTQAKTLLQWVPENDDLDQIVDNALAWEKKLSLRNDA